MTIHDMIAVAGAEIESEWPEIGSFEALQDECDANSYIETIWDGADSVAQAVDQCNYAIESINGMLQCA